MNIEGFVANFAAQFEETDAAEFSATTNFRDIEEWSSLTALSIIAMVDDEYDVQIKGADIQGSTTVEDLFNVVKSKM